MKPLEWSEGDTKKVRWSTVGTPAQYVKLEVVSAHTFDKELVIASNAPNSGCFVWNIPRKRLKKDTEYCFRIIPLLEDPSLQTRVEGKGAVSSESFRIASVPKDHPLEQVQALKPVPTPTSTTPAGRVRLISWLKGTTINSERSGGKFQYPSAGRAHRSQPPVAHTCQPADTLSEWTARDLQNWLRQWFSDDISVQFDECDGKLLRQTWNQAAEGKQEEAIQSLLLDRIGLDKAVVRLATPLLSQLLHLAALHDLSANGESLCRTPVFIFRLLVNRPPGWRKEIEILLHGASVEDVNYRDGVLDSVKNDKLASIASVSSACVVWRDDDARCALHYCKSEAMVEALLEKCKGSLRARDKHGSIPLVYYIQRQLMRGDGLSRSVVGAMARGDRSTWSVPNSCGMSAAMLIAATDEDTLPSLSFPEWSVFGSALQSSVSVIERGLKEVRSQLVKGRWLQEGNVSLTAACQTFFGVHLFGNKQFLLHGDTSQKMQSLQGKVWESILSLLNQLNDSLKKPQPNLNESVVIDIIRCLLQSSMGPNASLNGDFIKCHEGVQNQLSSVCTDISVFVRGMLAVAHSEVEFRLKTFPSQNFEAVEKDLEGKPLPLRIDGPFELVDKTILDWVAPPFIKEMDVRGVLQLLEQDTDYPEHDAVVELGELMAAFFKDDNLEDTDEKHLHEKMICFYDALYRHESYRQAYSTAIRYLEEHVFLVASLKFEALLKYSANDFSPSRKDFIEECAAALRFMKDNGMPPTANAKRKLSSVACLCTQMISMDVLLSGSEFVLPFLDFLRSDEHITLLRVENQFNPAIFRSHFGDRTFNVFILLSLDSFSTGFAVVKLVVKLQSFERLALVTDLLDWIHTSILTQNLSRISTPFGLESFGSSKISDNVAEMVRFCTPNSRSVWYRGSVHDCVIRVNLHLIEKCFGVDESFVEAPKLTLFCRGSECNLQLGSERRSGPCGKPISRRVSQTEMEFKYQFSVALEVETGQYFHFEAFFAQPELQLLKRCRSTHFAISDRPKIQVLEPRSMDTWVAGCDAWLSWETFGPVRAINAQLLCDEQVVKTLMTGGPPKGRKKVQVPQLDDLQVDEESNIRFRGERKHIAAWSVVFNSAVPKALESATSQRADPVRSGYFRVIQTALRVASPLSGCKVLAPWGSASFAKLCDGGGETLATITVCSFGAKVRAVDLSLRRTVGKTVSRVQTLGTNVILDDDGKVLLDWKPAQSLCEGDGYDVVAQDGEFLRVQLYPHSYISSVDRPWLSGQSGVFSIIRGLDLFVCHPKSGDVWIRGDSVRCQWEGTSNVGPVDVYLYVKGARVRTLATAADCTAAVSFVVDSSMTASEYCWIEVCSLRTTVKSALFTIRGESYTSLLEPSEKRAHKWTLGSSELIRWHSSPDISSVKIEVRSQCDHRLLDYINKRAPPSGEMYYTVRADYAAYGISENEMVIVALTGRPSGGVTGFKTVSESSPIALVPSTICVTQPKAADSAIGLMSGFEVGSTVPITWETTGNTIKSVSVELMKQGEVVALLCACTSNIGRWDWVGVDCPPGDKYQFRVCSVQNSALASRSYPFTIVPLPSIHIDEPGIETQWRWNSTVTAKWRTKGRVGCIRAVLMRDNRQYITLASAIPDEGWHEMVLPSPPNDVLMSVNPTARYSLQLRSVLNRRVSCVSQKFKIHIQPNVCDVELEHHSSGVTSCNIVPGEPMVVRWKTMGIVTAFRIDLWSSVHCRCLVETTQEKSFIWIPPDFPCACGNENEEHRVRVTACSEARVFSMSDPLHVTPHPQLHISHPTSETVWKAGCVTETVKWSCLGVKGVFPTEVDVLLLDKKGSIVAKWLKSLNSGILNCSAPDVEDGIYKLLIECKVGKQGHKIRAFSELFSIEQLSSVVVHEPKAGTLALPGSQIKISWSAVNCGSVAVDVFCKGVLMYRVMPKAPEKGSTLFTFPKDCRQSSFYFVKVTAKAPRGGLHGVFANSCMLTVARPDALDFVSTKRVQEVTEEDEFSMRVRVHGLRIKRLRCQVVSLDAMVTRLLNCEELDDGVRRGAEKNESGIILEDVEVKLTVPIGLMDDLRSEAQRDRNSIRCILSITGVGTTCELTTALTIHRRRICIQPWGGKSGDKVREVRASGYRGFSWQTFGNISHFDLYAIQLSKVDGDSNEVTIGRLLSNGDVAAPHQRFCIQRSYDKSRFELRSSLLTVNKVYAFVVVESKKRSVFSVSEVFKVVSPPAFLFSFPPAGGYHWIYDAENTVQWMVTGGDFPTMASLELWRGSTLCATIRQGLVNPAGVNGVKWRPNSSLKSAEGIVDQRGYYLKLLSTLNSESWKSSEFSIILAPGVRFQSPYDCCGTDSSIVWPRGNKNPVSLYLTGQQYIAGVKLFCVANAEKSVTEYTRVDLEKVSIASASVTCSKHDEEVTVDLRIPSSTPSGWYELVASISTRAACKQPAALQRSSYFFVSKPEVSLLNTAKLVGQTFRVGEKLPVEWSTVGRISTVKICLQEVQLKGQDPHVAKRLYEGVDPDMKGEPHVLCSVDAKARTAVAQLPNTLMNGTIWFIQIACAEYPDVFDRTPLFRVDVQANIKVSVSSRRWEIGQKNATCELRWASEGAVGAVDIELQVGVMQRVSVDASGSPSKAGLTFVPARSLQLGAGELSTGSQSLSLSAQMVSGVSQDSAVLKARIAITDGYVCGESPLIDVTILEDAVARAEVHPPNLTPKPVASVYQESVSSRLSVQINGTETTDVSARAKEKVSISWGQIRSVTDCFDVKLEAEDHDGKYTIASATPGKSVELVLPAHIRNGVYCVKVSLVTGEQYGEATNRLIIM